MEAQPPPLPPPLPSRSNQTTPTAKLVPWRLAVVGITALALCAGAAWMAWKGASGMPLGCMFYKVTGLHCPGCGMTRATGALLEGNWLTAFAFNPLGVLILPLALIGTSLEAIGWVRNTTPPYQIPLGKYGYRLIAIAFVLFTILRNLPWYPFTLLAP